MVGTVSRAARVSGVTRNLKEAEGKIPARRTEIAYKAVTTGQAGTCLIKPNNHPEGVTVDAAGIYGRKVTRITQGGLSSRTGRNPVQGKWD